MFTTGASGGGIAVKDHDGSVIPELLFGGDHAQEFADAVAAAFNKLEPAEEGVTVQTFTSNGTFTWPVGVLKAKGRVWSGGAGAGASASGEGGGGGGAYIEGVITKTHATMSITVGAAVAVNTNGNTSEILQNGLQMLTAGGGTKGSVRTGGAGSTSVGYDATYVDAATLVSFNGGNGGTSVGTGSDGGGGGGGSAGSGSDGGDGASNGGAPSGSPTGGAGGTAGTGTYPGAAGGNAGNNGANGSDGTAPGGGGGGGGAGGTGGGGARGEVWIEYYQPSSLNLLGCGV